MTYFLNLFSPETYEIFSRSDRDISGFRQRQRKTADRVQVGDKLVCYMTKLSRWIGVLEVISEWYEDASPHYFAEDDPFVIRFKVRPVVWLEKEYSVPIRDDRIWNNLTFTSGQHKNSHKWTGKLRASLNQIDEDDGELIESTLLAQLTLREEFPIDEDEYQKLATHTVRRLDKAVKVSVPEDEEAESSPALSTSTEVRDSIKVQALIADIGTIMGMNIWIPRNDRARVLSEMSDNHDSVLDKLPLNYDDTTLKTIEQIDVLWLRGRTIVRAFEVEHTTSIYSGILRMADLLALQPNIDINLHIVAPITRKDDVFQQILRPVFSLLDKGPLAESCTYLSYDSLYELSALPHLSHYSDSVVDEYAEEAE
jgi:predicted RNA-binding protein